MASLAQQQQHSCTNTSSNLISTNGDNVPISDPAESQRLRDRLAHPRYRQKLKARLEELERATAKDAKQEEQNSSIKNTKESYTNPSLFLSSTSPKLTLQDMDIKQQNESLTTQNSTDLSLEYFPPIPNHTTYLASEHEKMYNNRPLIPAISIIQPSMPIAATRLFQPSSAHFSGVVSSYPIPMGPLPYSANLYEFMTIPYTSTYPHFAALGYNITTLAPYVPYSPNTTDLTTEPVLQNGRKNITGSTKPGPRQTSCNDCRRRKVKCGSKRAKCVRQAREGNSQH